MRLAALIFGLSVSVAMAQSIPFAGTSWKLDPAKSSGRVPACLTSAKGILAIPRQINTGSLTDKPVGPLAGKCTQVQVYRFEWSADGGTLIVTPPDANFKAVFDKQ
jgi:hypothetical protein